MLIRAYESTERHGRYNGEVPWVPLSSEPFLLLNALANCLKKLMHLRECSKFSIREESMQCVSIYHSISVKDDTDDTRPIF